MKTKLSTEHDIRDIYAAVTAKIVASMEASMRPWAQPWKQGSGAWRRPVRHNGEPYRGVNTLLLWSHAREQNFSSNRWMTYKQAEAIGAQVRKRERGCMVVYASRITPDVPPADCHDATAEDHGGKSVAFLRAYTVFNLDQLQGLPASYSADAEVASTLGVEGDSRLNDLIEGTAATIRHGGDRAFYAPDGDFVQIPTPAQFRDSASYAATLLHELAHWTGHPSRLAREFGRRFGDQAYAVEELVAELSSAFICADLGMSAEPREDHAAYLSHWLQVLKADKRAIFSAAAHAQRAADYLHQCQGVAHA
jgi:antirestriction protein ArdC